MKKLYVVLAAIIVIRLGAIAFFETQLLDEPIILAQDIDFDNDALYISYITNRTNPHEISSVIIDDRHFYPYQETDLFGFHSNSNQSSIYVSGRLYSIHSVTFPLQSEWNELDLSNQTTSTIHFTDGIQFEEQFTPRRHWVDQTILDNYYSTSSSDGTGKSYYITEQDVVLTNLTFEQLEDLTLVIDRVQVDLPIKMPITIPNESRIEISYKSQIGFYPEDRSEIIFYFLDEHNVPIEIPVGGYKNNPPNSEWIDQYVKGRAKK